MSIRTSNAKRDFLIALNLLIFIWQNPYQTCGTICAAKHQHSDNSLKIKFKTLKELEKDTPHKDVASLSGVPKNTLSTWKNTEKFFQLYDSGLGAKRVKPEKNEALNKELKKWLLILRSENVLINGPLLKGKGCIFETNKYVYRNGYLRGCWL